MEKLATDARKTPGPVGGKQAGKNVGMEKLATDARKNSGVRGVFGVFGWVFGWVYSSVFSSVGCSVGCAVGPVGGKQAGNSGGSGVVIISDSQRRDQCLRTER
jgi:hypothetical protein